VQSTFDSARIAVFASALPATGSPYPALRKDAQALLAGANPNVNRSEPARSFDGRPLRTVSGDLQVPATTAVPVDRLASSGARRRHAVGRAGGVGQAAIMPCAFERTLVEGTEPIPTTGAFSVVPPSEPANPAVPKANTPPSEAAIQ